MKKVFYKTTGTCSQYMEVYADEDQRIQDINVIGGCSGNIQGICALVKGMPLKEAKDKLKGIRCGYKPTSCPDQLSQAIEELEKQYQ